jgi:hypothetical protein
MTPGGDLAVVLVICPDLGRDNCKIVALVDLVRRFAQILIFALMHRGRSD